MKFSGPGRRGGGPVHSTGGHDPENAGHPAAKLYQDGIHLLDQRQVRVNRTEPLVKCRRVEKLLDRGLEQGILVGEHAKNGALGDAGRLGNPPGGDLPPLLHQERDDRVDDHRAPVIRR